MKKFLFLLFVALVVSAFPAVSSAKDEVVFINDWYIQTFDSTIVVNKDSSLLITEDIVADCGNLPNKHGIFRVLPKRIKTDRGVIKNPIELVGITDFNGKPYNYSTISDASTVTWKIGDPNVVVSGVNNYRIIYKVKNAVRFANNDFDELYWNLVGQDWSINIDYFTGKIIFPKEINQQNTEIYYYAGRAGSKDNYLADYKWTDNNTIFFESTNIIEPGNDITVSATFPKGIIDAYVPTFWEKYADYFWFAVPLIIFLLAYFTWLKYGKDPKMKFPIPPEFGVPENITPVQMGMVISFGRWSNNFIAAGIVNLAVKGFITIEEDNSKMLGIFPVQNVNFIKNATDFNLENLPEFEKKLMDVIFYPKKLYIDGEAVEQLGKIITDGKEQSQKMASLSEVKEKLGVSLSDIKLAASNETDVGKWIVKKSTSISWGFIFLGVLIVIYSFFTAPFSWQMFVSVLMSGFLVFAFGMYMPKRTKNGTDLMFKILGFKRYMEQAEDYRQQFYEKENIFDKFLPYAIIFGIAKEWAKKMEQIYGKDYFVSYHPVWYVGNYKNFDIGSFSSRLNSITSSVSGRTGGYSGSGGGGFSGGGGGGGGGGGW